jgi:hypothetical protein
MNLVENGDLMAKRRIVVIEKCSDCPYDVYLFSSDGSSPFWCGRMKRELHDRNVIPDWCTLPEAPEKKGDNEDENGAG